MVLTGLYEVSCTKILFKAILHNHRKASVNKNTMAGDGFYLLRGYIRLLGQWDSVARLKLRHFRNFAFLNTKEYLIVTEDYGFLLPKFAKGEFQFL